MYVTGLLKTEAANPAKAGCIAGIAGVGGANAYGLQLSGLYHGLIGLIPDHGLIGLIPELSDAIGYGSAAWRAAYGLGPIAG
jgi:hypothetical protein